MQSTSLERLELLFRDAVLKFLIKEGTIDQATADQICSWRHSGFGTDELPQDEVPTILYD